MRYSLKTIGCQFLFAILTVLVLFSVKAVQSAEITKLTPTRLSFSLSGEWKYMDDSIGKEKGMSGKWFLPSHSDNNWNVIKIPDPWWSLKEERLRWYRKNFVLPASFENKTIILRFMAAKWHCKVWLNGHYLGEHIRVTGGTVPFQFDVSKYIRFASSNLLTIRLYWHKRPHTRGAGMEGEIECLAVPETHIGKVLIDTSYTGWFKARLNIQKATKNAEKDILFYEIKEHKSGKLIKEGNVRQLEINQGVNECSFEANVKDVSPWASECPNLYDIFLCLKDSGGKIIDVWKDTIGFRTFEAKGRNFYLNGKIFHPFGNGCGVYPKYGGMSIGGSQGIDAEGKNPVWTHKSRFKFLRNMGINFLRSHVGMVRAHYCPIMDEIGMMHEIEFDWPEGIINVRKDITEGKERAYSPELKENFRELIEYYYNRPSTVMWCTGNERWNVATKPLYAVPLLNELYDVARSIDPYRPIVNFEGAYCKNHGPSKALFPHVDKLKSDVAAVHAYYGWKLGPVQTIAIDAEYYNSWVKKPIIITESVGCYVGNFGSIEGLKWFRIMGEEQYKKKNRKLQSIYAARVNKETLEYERMHPDIFAGSCYFHNMYNLPTQKVLKRVYSPIFTCLNIDAKGKNYFSGANIPVTLYLLNDYLYKEVKQAKIELELADSSGKKLFQWEKNVSLPVTSFQTFPLEIKIPENIPTGDYSINLFLKEGQELLNDNSYQIFVMSRKDIPASIKTTKKVLVIEKKEDGRVSDILNGLGVKYAKWDIQSAENNLRQLKDYDVLIICPEVIGSSDIFFEKGPILKKFVSRGGRLLCMEQHSGLFMGWIPVDLFFDGTIQRKSLGRFSNQNWVIHIKDFSHPIFKGISSVARFDTWNGDYGIIADTVLVPEDIKRMKKALLGVTTIIGAHKIAPTIIDLKYGDGEYLFSQLNAVSRWNNDPVATRYIVNLLNYIISEPSAVKSLAEKKETIAIGNGPFTPDKEGFIRHWLVCGPFPNPGGRPYGNPPKQSGFNTDYLLKREGGFWTIGEIEKAPMPGNKEESLFLKEVDGHNWWKFPTNKKLELSWRKYASDDGYFDLQNLMSYFKNNIIAYAACYVESPKDMKAKVKLGSDDGYKLWLSHKHVGEFDTVRGANPDDETYKVHLKKGSNLVLLKVIQDTGGFGFYLRFTDLNDKPLTNLKVWLVPNIKIK